MTKPSQSHPVSCSSLIWSPPDACCIKGNAELFALNPLPENPQKYQRVNEELYSGSRKCTQA